MWQQESTLITGADEPEDVRQSPRTPSSPENITAGEARVKKAGPMTDFESYYEVRNQTKYVTSDNPHNIMLVQRMAQWLQLSPDDVVLDVGCSDGYFLQALHNLVHFGSGTGVDISPSTVAAAATITNDASLHFETASADKLPFPDGTFTKVLVNELIEHIPDDEGGFREVARVLKPRGLAYITAPNDLERMLPIFREYCRKVDRVEGHLRRYTIDGFREMAGRHGLRVLKVRYEGFLAGYLWYNFIVYNQPLKRMAMRAISSSAPTIGSEPTRPKFNGLAILPFAMMRFVSALDAPFSGYHRSMGFHALLQKE